MDAKLPYITDVAEVFERASRRAVSSKKTENHSSAILVLSLEVEYV